MQLFKEQMNFYILLIFHAENAKTVRSPENLRFNFIYF